ncbi:response regulator [Aquimarina sp. BL5]|uniref:response regulator n=1 Tax=Aquimarina sp. BL5 TaxID=1714860 RepID=UPI000E4D0339|nr:response regulator [Aquimarina sp. BL5]AXT50432.1 response regulator [Aquimarina sp. BL5]RKN03092.1 response regulator [Aquimarina sp. BL5]
MTKLKRFLLVDDSNSTNFFNKTIIQKTDCVEEVLIATNGSNALKYLQSDTIPEIIFLDLNMPVMNGWEFLEQHNQLSAAYKSSKIIIMIGAKLRAEEEKMLKSFPQVTEFREKMLTKEIVLEIVSKYFNKPSN